MLHCFTRRQTETYEATKAKRGIAEDYGSVAVVLDTCNAKEVSTKPVVVVISIDQSQALG